MTEPPPPSSPPLRRPSRPPPPPPPPPQSRLNLRTTAQVIKQSSTTFFSNLTTFLFLSLLLFSFRTTVETGTRHVTSFIDRDPSIKSLISRLDLSGQTLRSPDTPHSRRRRPVLRFTRIGHLDEDFFSDDNFLDRTLFGSNHRPPINITRVNLNHFFRSEEKLGFSQNDLIRFPEIFGSGLVFETRGFDLEVDNYDGERLTEEDLRVQAARADMHFFRKALELGKRDAALLLFLVSFLSALYGWLILGFLVINSCIVGIVFFAVVNDHLGKFDSFIGTIWSGSRLGLKRLSSVILMRWAIRDAMTQVLGLWYFGEIEDQHSFFKLFVRLKVMPLSVTPPWIRGYETQISQFLVAWLLSDAFIAFLFAVDCWVAIMDVRSGKEIVKEGVYLIWTMLHQALQLKCFEAILCGPLVRFFITRMFGETLATVFQSAVEVYFMVVWLIYYFAVRSKDASSDGRYFGRRDLEDNIDAFR